MPAASAHGGGGRARPDRYVAARTLCYRAPPADAVRAPMNGVSINPMVGHGLVMSPPNGTASGR